MCTTSVEREHEPRPRPRPRTRTRTLRGKGKARACAVACRPSPTCVHGVPRRPAKRSDVGDIWKPRACATLGQGRVLLLASACPSCRSKTRFFVRDRNVALAIEFVVRSLSLAPSKPSLEQLRTPTERCQAFNALQDSTTRRRLPRHPKNEIRPCPTEEIRNALRKGQSTQVAKVWHEISSSHPKRPNHAYLGIEARRVVLVPQKCMPTLVTCHACDLPSQAKGSRHIPSHWRSTTLFRPRWEWKLLCLHELLVSVFMHVHHLLPSPTAMTAERSARCRRGNFIRCSCTQLNRARDPNCARTRRCARACAHGRPSIVAGIASTHARRPSPSTTRFATPRRLLRRPSPPWSCPTSREETFTWSCTCRDVVFVVFVARLGALVRVWIERCAEAMAEHLATIFGTEKDRVNCPFYFKIGRCRCARTCRWTWCGETSRGSC